MECYRNINNGEIVYKEEAEDYALTQLGMKKNGKLVIIPMGENGEYTVEQLENIENIVEWFFSGNWIEEDINEVDEEDITDLKYEIGRYENYHEVMFESKVY